MSRFFAAGGSSSSDSDDSSLAYSDSDAAPSKSKDTRRGLFEALSLSEEEYSEEESEGFETFSQDEEGAEGSVASQQAAPVRKSRFMFDTESDSEDEGGVQRLVKSHKAKVRDEMESLTEMVEDGMDQKDWVVVQERTHHV